MTVVVGEECVDQNAITLWSQPGKSGCHSFPRLVSIGSEYGAFLFLGDIVQEHAPRETPEEGEPVFVRVSPLTVTSIQTLEPVRKIRNIREIQSEGHFRELRGFCGHILMIPIGNSVPMPIVRQATRTESPWFLPTQGERNRLLPCRVLPRSDAVRNLVPRCDRARNLAQGLPPSNSAV